MFKFCLPIAAPVLRFVRDQNGATSIEYAMIASCVAVIIAASVTNLCSPTFPRL
jgi:Flp pilus assembly pilin Flp